MPATSKADAAKPIARTQSRLLAEIWMEPAKESIRENAPGCFNQVKIFSGAAMAPRKGTTNPKLIASASPPNSMQTNRSPNCFFLFRERTSQRIRIVPKCLGPTLAFFRQACWIGSDFLGFSVRGAEITLGSMSLDALERKCNYACRPAEQSVWKSYIS